MKWIKAVAFIEKIVAEVGKEKHVRQFHTRKNLPR